MFVPRNPLTASSISTPELRRRITLAVTQFLADLATEICPHCQQQMTREQRGPDVYAIPCGHRLYQGRLPV
jgi:hypothetical protein